MAYEVTIMSAIDELQRMFRKLNEKYFDNELEKVIITIQADVTSGAYAWISENPVWNDKTKQMHREINITAEHMQREADLIITSLLHEMCHLKNIQDGIQDTSRSGTYHNKHFKEVAETRDLIIGKHEMYGYCITTPTIDLSKWINENCRVGCFRYQRAKTYKSGTPKITKPGKDGKEKTISRTKQSSRKYVCPSCGLTVRATREVVGKLLCVDCNKILIEN